MSFHLYIGTTPILGCMSNGLGGGLYVSQNSSFDSDNYDLPTDCSNPSFWNSAIIEAMDIQDLENPDGLIVTLYITLSYTTYDYKINEIICNDEIIWEGEVHFDPEHPCKLHEIKYE